MKQRKARKKTLSFSESGQPKGLKSIHNNKTETSNVWSVFFQQCCTLNLQPKATQHAEQRVKYLISKGSVWQGNTTCFPTNLLKAKGKAAFTTHEHLKQLVGMVNYYVHMVQWMPISSLINYWSLIEAFAKLIFLGHLSDRISNSTKKKRNAAAAAAGMRVFIHELTDQRSRIDLNFYEYFIIVFPFHYFKVNQEKLCVLSTSAIPQVVTSSELSFYYDTDTSQSINSSFFHT